MSLNSELEEDVKRFICSPSFYHECQLFREYVENFLPSL